MYQIVIPIENTILMEYIELEHNVSLYSYEL